jgi:hypothetical protein
VNNEKVEIDIEEILTLWKIEARKYQDDLIMVKAYAKKLEDEIVQLRNQLFTQEAKEN